MNYPLPSGANNPTAEPSEVASLEHAHTGLYGLMVSQIDGEFPPRPIGKDIDVKLSLIKPDFLVVHKPQKKQYTLVAGLTHFSIYWECHHPN